MHVNVGAGRRVLEGWYNCDVQQHPEAHRPLDAVCDAKSIPLPDASADVLQAIHLWEHFYRWDCDAVITEWRRILKPGGMLILELPNLVKACENYLSGRKRGGKDPDQLARWGIYGDPRTSDPYMNHRWGWSPQELIEYLHAHGFKSAYEKPTIFHPAGRSHRDMRIEAIR